MALVYRSAGSTLTYTQLDNNFAELDQQTSTNTSSHFTTQNLYADRLYSPVTTTTTYAATTIYLFGSNYPNTNRKVVLGGNATISFSVSGGNGSLFYGMIGLLAIKSNGYSYTFTDENGVIPVGMTEGFDAIRGNSFYPNGTNTWDFYAYWRCGYAAQGTPETPAVRVAYTGSAG